MSKSESPTSAVKPVSRTAWYTCGVRAEDARAPHSVLHDRHAEALMTPDGWELVAAMRDLPRASAGILARHRLIDDRVRALLAEDPELRIVILGAGLDTRAFRLPGGRWWELDEPAVIEFKERELPASSAPRPLLRIAVDFQHDSLGERLAAIGDSGPVLVIIEGVLLYLDADEQLRTAHALHGLGPEVRVLFDVMTPVFFKRLGHVAHGRLASFGAPFRMQDVQVARVWAQAGFQEEQRWSIPSTVRRLGLTEIPEWLLNSALIRIRDGYTVREMKYTRTP